MKKTIVIFSWLLLGMLMVNIEINPSNVEKRMNNLNFIYRVPTASAENAQCPCDENKDEVRFTVGIDVCWCIYSSQDCCCCSEG